MVDIFASPFYRREAAPAAKFRRFISPAFFTLIIVFKLYMYAKISRFSVHFRGVWFMVIDLAAADKLPVSLLLEASHISVDLFDNVYLYCLQNKVI